MNCLDCGPCGRKWNVHEWGEVRGLPLGSVPPDSCLYGAVGIQRTRRQPRGGRPLHIVDALLLCLATRRVNMHFEIIALIHFPFMINLHVGKCPYFFQAVKLISVMFNSMHWSLVFAIRRLHHCPEQQLLYTMVSIFSYLARTLPFTCIQTSSWGVSIHISESSYPPFLFHTIYWKFV